MRRITLIAIFVLLTIAACRPISRGPNPYQPASPLARGIESPLYSRGVSVIPDMPGGLIAPNDYRAGTIPLPILRLPVRAYLPIVAGYQNYPCYTNAMAAELLRLMITDRVQQRVNPHCDSVVTKIAQMRADDMVTNEYFSHRDLRGHGANFYLAQIGCLPAWYPADGNSVESITLNYHTAQAAWNALVSSRGHRPHVLGMHPFFSAQVAIGVGWAKSDWGIVFVIISVPDCD
jgi:uncharacterized protein YkwD